jgi:hypothetical protein
MPVDVLRFPSRPAFDVSHLKEADIQDGEMLCSVCKQSGEPILVEYGYTLTHNLKEFQGNRIVARGGVDFSDEGDVYLLLCTHCEEPYTLPKQFEIAWE